MRQYRIINVTWKNGEEKYLIQKRVWLVPFPIRVWKTFDEGGGWDPSEWWLSKRMGTGYYSLKSAEEELKKIFHSNGWKTKKIKVVGTYDKPFAVEE